MQIGKMISDRRKELGLTLEDVGNAVGVGKSTVLKWESGFISNMRRDKIALLAKVLEIDPATLLTGETPATNNDNGRVEEFVELFGRLTPEQQSLIISQIKGILSNQ